MYSEEAQTRVAREGRQATSRMMEDTFSLEALESLLGRLDTLAGEPPERAVSRWLRQLLSRGLDRLPLPGQGETLVRWRALATVAAFDLGLIKLYEGHTDALAILSELGAEPPPAGSVWGVWASEPPQARVKVTTRGDGRVELNGRKAWCSGAPYVSHALVTAWDVKDQQCLVAVEMEQAGVQVTNEGWHAVGMASSASVDVLLQGAEGVCVGEPGSYVARPGFWQGGAGIAACWYGAATAVGETLRAHCARRDEPHARAHLGAVDTALVGARALLREAAAWIDAHPQEDPLLLTQRVRLGVEAAAQGVMSHTARAVGAGPLCRDARVARRMADLPVFLRQSHAERDLDALAGLVVKHAEGAWML